MWSLQTIIHWVPEDRKHLWRMSGPIPMFRPESTRAAVGWGPYPFKVLTPARIETSLLPWASCSRNPVSHVRDEFSEYLFPSLLLEQGKWVSTTRNLLNTRTDTSKQHPWIRVLCTGLPLDSSSWRYPSSTLPSNLTPVFIFSFSPHSPNFQELLYNIENTFRVK